MEGKLEVYMDGGVRCGSDVFKALAMGARAVFIGRPVLWGLAYSGQEGVERVLELIRDEFQMTMKLAGNTLHACTCTLHRYTGLLGFGLYFLRLHVCLALWVGI